MIGSWLDWLASAGLEASRASELCLGSLARMAAWDTQAVQCPAIVNCRLVFFFLHLRGVGHNFGRVANWQLVLQCIAICRGVTECGSKICGIGD